MPLSTSFVIEHRSALNKQSVDVKGVVVSIQFPQQTEANNSNVAVANANPQPRMVLANNDRVDRDRRYDLTVLLPEKHDTYTVGKSVKVSGKIEGTGVAVILRSSR